MLRIRPVLRGIAAIAAIVLAPMLATARVAHGGGSLVVRPVASPDAIRAARAKGLPARAAEMTPSELATLQKRLELQRAFRPLHEAFRGPANVDRSRFAERRAGWREPAPRPSALERGSTPAGALPEPDTIRVAFLRVDFLDDRGGSLSSGDGHFDLTPADTTQPPIDRAPHNLAFYRGHAEALERYYDVQSYGRSVVEVDVWPQDENGAYSVTDMADFGPWTFSQSVYRDAVHMFRTMMFAADSQSIVLGDRIPWQKYDRVLVIHAGSDLQSDLRQDSKEDIPSFTLFMSDSDRVIFPDSSNRANPIDRCAFIPETSNQDGFFGTINGVIAHESGHLMYGFSDIYNVDTGYPVVGFWSLMDSGNLVGSRIQLSNGDEIFATGLLPPSVDPFQRQFTTDALNFLAPAWGDTLEIVGNERDPNMYTIPLTSDEYLILENRYLAPAAAVELDQDSVTRVILGPKTPDRFEYDALLPGGGILVWHLDNSVIPFEGSLRVNPDFGFNTNPLYLGEQVIEADGLDDLGDGGSPFILGSALDPYQKFVNPSLSDTTRPNLIPNVGSRPHLRIDFLDDALETMRFVPNHTWTLANFPRAASFSPGGIVPLAIDADGDRDLDVCWAGGDSASADSASLFAVRPSGNGLFGTSLTFMTLDHRPLPEMAAIATGDPTFREGPSLFAVTTALEGDASDPLGGRIWLVDHAGNPQPGWPLRPASPATTPPVIAGVYPSAVLLVGCLDGRVRAFNLDGSLRATGDLSLAGGVTGRLAFWQNGVVLGTSGVVSGPDGLVASGGADGDVAVSDLVGNTLGRSSQTGALTAWPQRLGGARFLPDFLWIAFGGAGANADDNCASSTATLVVHDADRLWAICPAGNALPGWGRSVGDTLVAGLGAGDPDGDGFPEVLTQTIHSQVAFYNRSGYPSPGWPKAGSREGFRTSSAPLALDLDQDGRAEVVTLNASGLLTAFDAAGKKPPGFPLGTGSGVTGSPLAADLNRDGAVDLVAPDRDGLLWAFSVPVPAVSPVATAWPMVGGDPGRTSALPAERTPSPAAATRGPLVPASLKAYPNPARRKPVSFAYTLTEPADVEFRILDTSGHEVASFTRHGMRADNLEVWEPGSLPSGLYIARLRFRSAGGDVLSSVPVGLLR